MANGKTYSILLTSVTCYGTSDIGEANDEVFILYQADGGPPIRYPKGKPVSMNVAGQQATTEWRLQLQIDFDYEALVTLWDEDSRVDLNASEFLINCDYTSGNPPSSYNMVNHNGANYTICAEPVG